MEINNGINIGSLFSLNKSKSSPTAEIVEFECYSFKKISQTNAASLEFGIPKFIEENGT